MHPGPVSGRAVLLLRSTEGTQRSSICPRRGFACCNPFEALTALTDSEIWLLSPLLLPLVAVTCCCHLLLSLVAATCCCHLLLILTNRCHLLLAYLSSWSLHNCYQDLTLICLPHL